MSGFNEDSAQPNTVAGTIESDVVTKHGDGENNSQRSVQVTDRFGLEKDGKGYLTRKYNIEISKAGNPYFAPVPSILASLVEDATLALEEARARVKGDESLRDEIAALAPAGVEYYEAWIEKCGEDRAWLARSIVIWPITDQVGYQLYKATSGEADLLDYAAYLSRTDDSITCSGDLDSHEGYQKRAGFTDRAYNELGVVDGLIAEMDEDSLDYNLEAIIRSGYQSAANLDTRNHLRGKTGTNQVTDDKPLDDFKAEVLASRRAASQAA